MKILVETSARHVHVTKEALEVLFGAGAELHVKKELSQPDQFLSMEKVNLIGPKKSLMGVSILGPVRSECQVEVSATDARTLGVAAPIRLSGDIKESAPITVEGPAGTIELKEGLIVAKRHIHATPEDAKALGIEHGENVSLKIGTPERALIFDDVIVRVSPKFKLVCHIDTDEANAANCSGEVFGEIVKK